MTPDEIRALKPGPELDRAIYRALFRDDSDPIAIRLTDAMLDLGDKPRPYSTTWSGLGLVVEEMERRGWRVGLEQLDEGPWMAGFAPRPDGEFVTCGYGERGSVVCKAALLALAAEKGKTP